MIPRIPIVNLIYPCRVPDMPSDYSSLLGWERSWEKTFALVYGITRESPNRQVWRDCRALYDACFRDTELSLLEEYRAGIAPRQADLAIELMEAFARRDFEGQWRAYTHREQRDVILQGLCRAAETAGRDCSMTGTGRFCCPDASLRRLTGRNGEGFLELAKSLLPSNLDTLGLETAYVHDPIVDYVFSLSKQTSEQVLFDSEDMWRRSFNDSRLHYLVELVTQILRVLRAEAPRQFSPTSRQVKQRFSRCEIPSPHEEPNPFVRKVMKTLLNDFKASIAELACASCFKTKAALPARHAYKRCAGCAKIGYEVLYCSRECQIRHWKEGSPPHKEECGRTQKELDAAAKRRVALPPAPWLPVADPGFTRSPALLYQLVTLRRDKGNGLDYVIFAAEPENDVAVRMSAETEDERARRSQFLALRDRAFRNADPDAVRALFALLCEHLLAVILDAAEYAWRVQKLCRQLEGEYGVDVGEGFMPLAAIPQPTEQEIYAPLLLECQDSLE